MNRIVIVGAGGLGREVLTLIRDINVADPAWEVLGFLASEAPEAGLLRRIDARHLGSDTDAVLLNSIRGCYFIAAIGAPATRRETSTRMGRAGLTPATLVHPTAVIGEDVVLEEGTFVCAGANLTTNIRVGRGCVVDRSVNIGHDCILGEFVTLAPGATVSGNVTLGDEVYMGTNSCTVQGLSVGAGTVIGAGAVVTRNVGDRLKVVGIPARPMGR